MFCGWPSHWETGGDIALVSSRKACLTFSFLLSAKVSMVVADSLPDTVSSKDRIYYNKLESEMQSTHRDRVLFLWWAFPHFPSGNLISGNTWDLHMFVILQVYAFFIFCSLLVSLHVQSTSKCYLCYCLIMNKWHNARGEILYIIIFKGHLIGIRCI